MNTWLVLGLQNYREDLPSFSQTLIASPTLMDCWLLRSCCHPYCLLPRRLPPALAPPASPSRSSPHSIHLCHSLGLSWQTLPGTFTHLLTRGDASVSKAPFSQASLAQNGAGGWLVWGDTGHWTRLLGGGPVPDLVPWVGTCLLISSLCRWA